MSIYTSNSDYLIFDYHILTLCVTRLYILMWISIYLCICQSNKWWSSIYKVYWVSRGSMQGSNIDFMICLYSFCVYVYVHVLIIFDMLQEGYMHLIFFFYLMQDIWNRIHNREFCHEIAKGSLLGFLHYICDKIRKDLVQVFEYNQTQG